LMTRACGWRGRGFAFVALDGGQTGIKSMSSKIQHGSNPLEIHEILIIHSIYIDLLASKM
jgi:hypothetical protein